MFTRISVLPGVRLAACALIAWGLAAACADTPASPPQPPPAPVLATIRVSPETTTVRTGQTVQLSAQLLDSAGHPVAGGPVVWRSADTTAAVVDATGLVTTRANGPVAIIGAVGAVSGRATITVIPAQAGTVEILPDTGTLHLGEQRLFDAYIYNASGIANGSNDFVWSTSDSTVLLPPLGGFTRGLRAGTAYLIVRLGRLADSVPITVLPDQEPIVAWPDTNGLFVGVTRQLRVRIQAGIGLPRDTTGATWTIANPSVATVDASGLVTARAPGRTTVLATLGTRQATAVVTVSPSPALAGESISTGANHTCALGADGTAYCWGSDIGAIGTTQPADRCDGSRTIVVSRSRFYEQWVPIRCAIDPVPVEGGLRFAALSAGDGHTCGLTADGTAYCWGRNSSGQLGIGTTDGSAGPTAVAGGIAFAEIAAGSGHTCGVARSGAAYCWGSGEFGTLGTGSETNRSQPTPVAGGLAFSHISVEAIHACGVATDGAAYCWGRNEVGELGIGPDVETCARDLACTTRPTAVQTATRFQTIATGTRLSCGVATDAAVWCWGTGVQGQLGSGSRDATRVPTRVGGGLRASQVAIEYFGQSACAVGLDGALQCWGLRIGDLPTRYFAPLTFTQVDLGQLFRGCGIATDRRAYCWPALSTAATVPQPVAGQR